MGLVGRVNKLGVDEMTSDLPYEPANLGRTPDPYADWAGDALDVESAAPVANAADAHPLARPDDHAPVSMAADPSVGGDVSQPSVKPLDTKHTPALRIARSRPERERRSQGARVTGRPPSLAMALENPPPLLRLRRLLVGVVLLALAWAGVLLVVYIAMALINGFPAQPHLSIRLALYLLGALGTAWLAIMTLASIIVGAFSLSLALTHSGW